MVLDNRRYSPFPSPFLLASWRCFAVSAFLRLLDSAAIHRQRK
jgi:hypothetical protein